MYRPVNKFFKAPKPIARINEEIKVPEVRVIDENGEHVGVMPIAEALKMAREREYDLVETNGATVPPIVKIIEYDKYRYQVEKKDQQKRKSTKRVEVKNVRLSVRIGQHDMDFKAKQADKFLSEGKKVKVEMFLKGRERANVPYAFEQVRKYLSLLQTPHTLEQELKKLGNTISAIANPGGDKKD